MSSCLPEKVILCGTEFSVADNRRDEMRCVVFERRGSSPIRFVFGWFTAEWLVRVPNGENFPTDLWLEARDWMSRNFRIECTPRGLRPARASAFRSYPISTQPPIYSLDQSPWAPGGCAGDTLGDAY